MDENNTICNFLHILRCCRCYLVFAQQDKTNLQISQNYATKFEVQLIQKEIEILKLEVRDFKTNFNTQINKMEEINDSILDLITDIRLTLASRNSD